MVDKWQFGGGGGLQTYPRNRNLVPNLAYLVPNSGLTGPKVVMKWSQGFYKYLTETCQIVPVFAVVGGCSALSLILRNPPVANLGLLEPYPNQHWHIMKFGHALHTFSEASRTKGRETSCKNEQGAQKKKKKQTLVGLLCKYGSN